MKRNGLNIAGRLGILVNAGLIALTILAIVKSCFISFDIDEAYAIAQSYRLTIGDHMFLEMWEPHQMSAFGAALFMVPYLAVTGGNTDGIVLYLRIVGTILHLLIGCGFYRAAKAKFDKQSALFVSLLHINFLPKWISMPEFEIMQYWSVCLLFLCFLYWNEHQNRKRADWVLFAAGTALFVCLMTYPTMLLLYPVYVWALYKLCVGDARTKLQKIAVFTSAPLLLGILFLAYVFSYMSVSKLVESIRYIFMDTSHSMKLSDRMYFYGQELVTFFPKLLGPVLILAVVLFLCKKKKVLKAQTTQSYILWGLLLLIGYFGIHHIWNSIFKDVNQFYLYFRFTIVALAGMVVLGLQKKRNSVYWLVGIVPGAVGVLASILVTNMTLEIAMARLYIAVPATFFVMREYGKEIAAEETIIKYTARITSILFLGTLLVSKLILIRITGCIPVTIRAELDLVKVGPAKGIYVKTELAQQFNENHEIIEQSIREGDRLLYFGCENLYYLSAEKTVPATPSVLTTAVFDELFLAYYEEHPERIPNVVIVDKMFPVNGLYRYSAKNQIVLDWIEEEFADAKVVETNYFTILRKE